MGQLGVSVGLITRRSLVQIAHQEKSLSLKVQPPLFLFSETKTISTSLPSKFFMAIICGVDEAGRGSVIGPLVMGGVLLDEKDEPILKALGVKDSKLLTPRNRKALVSAIQKTVKDFKLIQVNPKEIDAHVMSEDSNLNDLELLKTAEILNALKPEKAYIDCPSNNIKAYSSALKSLLKHDIELICAHKADSKYVSVGAASILAKVRRDEEIEKIKLKINEEFGSGYPSDPMTVEFLKKNYDKYPEIFRKSWASYKNVIERKKQKGLGDY